MTKKTFTLALVSSALLALASATANAAGQPAGQRDTVDAASTATTSALTRQDVQSELRQAIARGEQPAPGEGSDLAYSTNARTEPTSTLTRAQVRSDVLAARAAGDLLPAGEGATFEQYAHERRIAHERVAGRTSTNAKLGG